MKRRKAPTSDSVESSYISALCAPYDDQRVAFGNPYPHPRGKVLKALTERLPIDWGCGDEEEL